MSFKIVTKLGSPSPKPTVRLAQVLYVIAPLGEEFNLSGLPVAVITVAAKLEGHGDGTCE